MEVGHNENRCCFGPQSGVVVDAATTEDFRWQRHSPPLPGLAVLMSTVVDCLHRLIHEKAAPNLEEWASTVVD